MDDKKTITIPIEEYNLLLEKQKQVDELKEELKNLDWYKMWHKKFQKKIEDLTTELETYRPTKLSGHGQCKCSNCGNVSWTDWFSRYKGKTLCDKCLKEIVITEDKQAVKDTAKEIVTDIDDLTLLIIDGSKEFEKGYFQAIADMKTAIKDLLKEKYGVEVE